MISFTKCTTYFLMPFEIKPGASKSLQLHLQVKGDKATGDWKPLNIDEQGTKFHQHVSDILFKWSRIFSKENFTSSKEILSGNNYRILALDTSKEEFKNYFDVEWCYHYFDKTRLKASDEKTDGQEKTPQEGREHKLPFHLSSGDKKDVKKEDKRGVFPPHVILWETSGVGILSLPLVIDFEQSSDRPMYTLTNINYRFFKTFPRDYLNIDFEEKSEQIGRFPKNDKHNGSQISDDDNTWISYDLYKLLKESIENCLGRGVERFNPYRLFPLTCASISFDSKENKENILRDLRLVTRAMNSSYGVIPSGNEGDVLCQTFSNVYFGASVEGGGAFVLNNSSEHEPGNFFKNFQKWAFKTDYYWIFIMGLMQRYSLLQMDRDVSSYDDFDKDEKKSIRQNMSRLRDLSSRLVTAKRISRFASITDHYQHNIAYRHIVKMLEIDRLYATADEKLAYLHNILDSLTSKRNEKVTLSLSFLAIFIALISFINDAKQLAIPVTVAVIAALFIAISAYFYYRKTIR